MNLVLRDLYYNKLCASSILANRFHARLYKMGGIKVGAGVNICAHCFVGGKNLEIGNGTFINYNVWLNTAGGIKIGNNCNIAMNVSFITSTHEIGNKDRRAGKSLAQPIKVGNGCWIGANSVILPGVRIGDGVVIAAGAVVNADCDNNSIYAGVPAKKLRAL